MTDRVKDMYFMVTVLSTNTADLDPRPVKTAEERTNENPYCTGPAVR